MQLLAALKQQPADEHVQNTCANGHCMTAHFKFDTQDPLQCLRSDNFHVTSYWNTSAIVTWREQLCAACATRVLRAKPCSLNANADEA